MRTLMGALIGGRPRKIVRVCLLLRSEATGKDPTNRGKLGAKRHIVVDRNGLPHGVAISGSNVHESKMREGTVDAIRALRLPGKRRGRPRKRPMKLHADKGCDGTVQAEPESRGRTV
jgi:hypothetical protein